MKNISILFLLFSTFVYILLPVSIAPKPDIKTLTHYSKCSNPIKYRIGVIDERFQVAENQLMDYAYEAANIWNDAYGKNLLIYDKNATLTLNMLYDERQKITEKISDLEVKLDNRKSILDLNIATFNADVKKFENKLADLNDDIVYWNNLGGAPREEYDKIVQRQEMLKKEAIMLDSKAQELNLNRSTFNADVGKLNKNITDFNVELSNRPELGIYSGSRSEIVLYLYSDENELKHTLIHEFGHALGLGHSDDPQAIMYEYTNKSLRLNDSDKMMLEKQCRTISILDLLSERMMIVYEFITSSEFKDRIMSNLKEIIRLLPGDKYW